jgi:hypothetical protein
VTKAAVQAEYRVNGSNQRDSGHWIWSAPPAAMADDPASAYKVWMAVLPLISDADQAGFACLQRIGSRISRTGGSIR